MANSEKPLLALLITEISELFQKSHGDCEIDSLSHCGQLTANVHRKMGVTPLTSLLIVAYLTCSSPSRLKTCVMQWAAP